jgi:hypothetical protein
MTLDEYKKLTPDERRAYLKANKAANAERVLKYGLPSHQITPEIRAYEIQRIAEESARLYGGRTWDGKHWRNPDGTRVVIGSIKQ